MSPTDWDDTLPEKGRRAWKRASKDEREEALNHATAFLDTLAFKGRPANETQSLAWPREGVFRDDGTPITGVPEEIKDAICLVAGFLLAGIPHDKPAIAWVMLKIGHLLKDDFSFAESDVTWH